MWEPFKRRVLGGMGARNIRGKWFTNKDEVADRDLGDQVLPEVKDCVEMVLAAADHQPDQPGLKTKKKTPKK